MGGGRVGEGGLEDGEREELEGKRGDWEGRRPGGGGREGGSIYGYWEEGAESESNETQTATVGSMVASKESVRGSYRLATDSGRRDATEDKGTDGRAGRVVVG